MGLLLVPMALALSACQNGEKQAGQLFQRAESAYAAGEYSLAKLQIDSIRTLYPKAFEVRKAGIKLMQQIDLAEQTKTLAYLDSMMTVKQAALDSIKESLYWKRYSLSGSRKLFLSHSGGRKNIGRSFLRAQVSELGEMSLTSICCAGGSIHHTAVKVSVDDTFAETPTSIDSYETTDLGRPVEKADYKLGNDGGVIAFLVANRDKKNIRLEFIGDRNYKTVMHPNDVKAVAELSDLARVLSAIEEIKKEQKEANLKIKFVKRKMEENTEE